MNNTIYLVLLYSIMASSPAFCIEIIDITEQEDNIPQEATDEDRASLVSSDTASDSVSDASSATPSSFYDAQSYLSASSRRGSFASDNEQPPTQRETVRNIMKGPAAAVQESITVPTNDKTIWTNKIPYTNNPIEEYKKLKKRAKDKVIQEGKN